MDALLSGQALPEGDAAAPRRRKPTIMLQYDDDAIGIGKRLLFEAETPAAALEIAAGEAAGRHASLFVDGEPLCSLLKTGDEHPYWIVAGPAGAATAALQNSEENHD
ncbi:hypothetical protein [Sphingopyxis sp. JAI128]|uniref:hypothetical protein n=1 Tax=Sphingopyxis sp. JAI128 TaxID=2723066 RepID=UPI001616DFC8|nr:hypothetical protein [Sphingopyxis sp. JAI128]MBB6425365.1 hypothetical protein [Sphingopyxis sp. JAI128]